MESNIVKRVPTSLSETSFAYQSRYLNSLNSATCWRALCIARYFSHVFIKTNCFFLGIGNSQFKVLRGEMKVLYGTTFVAVLASTALTRKTL